MSMIITGSELAPHVTEAILLYLSTLMRECLGPLSKKAETGRKIYMYI